MKTLLQSRTVQLALIQAISGGLIIYFTQMDMVGVATIIKSVADILLRMDTDEPVAGIF